MSDLDWEKANRKEAVRKAKPESSTEKRLEARADSYLSKRPHGAFVLPKGKLAQARAKLDQERD